MEKLWVCFEKRLDYCCLWPGLTSCLSVPSLRRRCLCWAPHGLSQPHCMVPSNKLGRTQSTTQELFVVCWCHQMHLQEMFSLSVVTRLHQKPTYFRASAQRHLFPFMCGSSLPNFISPLKAFFSLPSEFMWSNPLPSYKEPDRTFSVGPSQTLFAWSLRAGTDLTWSAAWRTPLIMKVPAPASHYIFSVCANLPTITKSLLRRLFSPQIHLHLNCLTHSLDE